jgi:hypothetical protein
LTTISSPMNCGKKRSTTATINTASACRSMVARTTSRLATVDRRCRRHPSRHRTIHQHRSRKGPYVGIDDAAQAVILGKADNRRIELSRKTAPYQLPNHTASESIQQGNNYRYGPMAKLDRAKHSRIRVVFALSRNSLEIVEKIIFFTPHRTADKSVYTRCKDWRGLFAGQAAASS